MKKSELKNGMLVETRRGEIGTIILGFSNWGDCLIFSGNSWTGLDSFDEDTLEWYPDTVRDKNNRTEHQMSVDIMKVYLPNLPTGLLNQDEDKGKLIWKRPLFNSGWYVQSTDEYPEWLMYYDYDNKLFYGFNTDGNWCKENNNDLEFTSAYIQERCKPANIDFIKLKLKNEASKRGFVFNSEFIDNKGYTQTVGSFKQYNEIENKLEVCGFGRHIIFQNGIWSEITKEKFYKVGQSFSSKDGREFILSQTSAGKVSLISLTVGGDAGNRYKDAISVDNILKISSNEFKNITGNLELELID